MMSRQTPTVLCLQRSKRSKQWRDSTYCGSCRNILIVYQHTDVVVLPSSELYLLHWLDMQKKQNSPLKWSRAVKSSLCTPLCPGWLHYTCEKRLVALLKLLKHEQGLNKLPCTHGAWLEHTRRAHMQANVWSRGVVSSPSLWSLGSTSIVADYCQCKPRKHQLQN